MAWTKNDIPELTARRDALLGMIEHHEAGHPATRRQGGEVVNDVNSDLAKMKTDLAEVEHYLASLGVPTS